MNETTHRKWLAYLVNGVIALVVIVLVALRQGLSMEQPFFENCRDLSDG